MKIAINAQQIQEQNPAGPEVFTINLIKALAKIDSQNEYLLYCSKKPSIQLQLAPNFTIKVSKPLISWTHISLAWQLFLDKPDIYYTAVHTLPFIKNPKTKYISMIHGLEFTYLNGIKKWTQELPTWLTVTFSNLIIVPSNATKQAIIKRFHTPESKIKVVPEGVGEQYTKTQTPQTNNIVFISTIQPRKNIPNTVAGFANSLKKQKIPSDTQLIIIGKKGWLYKKSLSAPQKYGVEQNVQFADRLNEKDVVTLLSGAKLFINLSFMEGFGLPLLEAMMCKVPCLVSDIPAFRELGQDTVLYANPYDISDISNKITQAINNYDQNKIEEAYKHAQTFTWEKTAQSTLKLFNI